ncbi:MAG: zinc-binding dehydrogenase [Trueperaceae bacterium]
MNVVVATAFGAPDVLRLEQRPEPAPGLGEVTVRTAFASVNFADVKARRGGHHTGTTVPFVPGLDVAGTVERVGAGVTGLRIGQWVAAATDGGAYAEVVRARAALVFPLTEGVDPRQAAGVVALMTAYNVLLVKGALQPGETVLVQAAAGGVGSLLLQLAKLHGAGHVIGVVGSTAKVETARRLGADDVLVVRDEDLRPHLTRAAPNGIDVALDSAGGDAFVTAFEALRPFGRIVNFGDAGGTPGPVSVSRMHKQNLTVVGYSSGHYRKHRPEGVRLAAERALAHVAAGELQVEVTRTFPLAAAAEAHRLIESRASTGKLLLAP